MNTFIEREIKNQSFQEVEDKIISLLKEEEFGIVSRIDFNEIFKEKLGINFKPYVLLGACNPSYSYKGVTLESKLGTLLPCNFLIQKDQDKSIHVSFIDPATLMQSIPNESIKVMSLEIKQIMQKLLNRI